MKKVGAEKIFKQSVTKHSLYYISFYGDDYLKTFPAAENVYGPEKPVKSMNVLVTIRKGL